MRPSRRRVRVSWDNRQVQVSVSDQGVGIHATALPHARGQRFYRADHECVRGIGGLGVGLYVVKEVIALHGGTVEVTSAEGAGSTFTVQLPYQQNTSFCSPRTGSKPWRHYRTFSHFRR